MPGRETTPSRFPQKAHMGGENCAAPTNAESEPKAKGLQLFMKRHSTLICVVYASSITRLSPHTWLFFLSCPELLPRCRNSERYEGKARACYIITGQQAFMCTVYERKRKRFAPTRERFLFSQSRDVQSLTPASISKWKCIAAPRTAIFISIERCEG